jgi:hypothetical protein
MNDLYFDTDNDPEKLNQIHGFANSIGVSPSRYESLVERRWIDEMKFCGCGNPEDAQDYLRRILAAHKAKSDDYKAVERVILAEPEKAALIIYYLLDAMGLTEHGGSVYGSWLSDKGQRLLEELEADANLKTSDG